MSDTNWDAIAEYVRTVARQAFLRGFSSGAMNAGASVNYAAAFTDAEDYVRTGFDAETVRKYHPSIPEHP